MTLIISFYAIYKGERMLPKYLKAQSVRFITNGASLLFVLFSYAYLSAGTVSLLQRLDIPFLIFLSLFLKKPQKRYQIILSIATVATVLYLAINPSVINESATGFLLVFGSVSLTAVGYFTLHKGSNIESVPSLINVAAISCIIFGLFAMISFNCSWALSFKNAFVILLSSVASVVLFYILIGFYKIYTPERALLPFVLAIFFTSVIEMVIEKKMYTPQNIIIASLITIMISIICLGGKKVNQINSI